MPSDIGCLSRVARLILIGYLRFYLMLSVDALFDLVALDETIPYVALKFTRRRIFR